MISKIVRHSQVTQIGRLSLLTHFSVRHNDISGHIPTEVGYFTDMKNTLDDAFFRFF